MRLTLLYASLFLVSGTTLLTIVLFLVFGRHLFITYTPDPPPPLPGVGRCVMRGAPIMPAPGTWTVTPASGTVRVLIAQAVIGLAVMAFVSTGLGWIVAGRALKPLRVMAAKARSISERNLHERLALTGPRDEINELADTVDGLLARLESAFEAQRRFVANASHELRTPLAMMRTSVDVAVSKPPPVSRDVTVLAGKLREGLDRADRLLEGLLMLARAQTNGHASAEEVSLARLTAAALDARAKAIAERGLSVEDRTGGRPLRGNATLLASMVDNLIDNAIRYGPPGGRLRVATVSSGPRSCYVVENGGAVLDQREVDLLGQPFQRLGAERTSRSGTGLGLSIVAAIAAAHGGRLALYARPEGGLRAEVRL
ncbi:sensor histidine kinase [Actinomadura macrotermitis]|uniref:histidine kinase n=1 Tax=Actinomadura macrotermitis TaxID=2585200 RepID=A0A7K0BXH3_9ACTN|nr:ATP-binding protein [Actinomadura macrotermitis]MQY05552.1 Adaptive-response sensory-kinase SasA [Actinomadura macrotermitis]